MAIIVVSSVGMLFAMQALGVIGPRFDNWNPERVLALAAGLILISNVSVHALLSFAGRVTITKTKQLKTQDLRKLILDLGPVGAGVYSILIYFEKGYPIYKGKITVKAPEGNGEKLMKGSGMLHRNTEIAPIRIGYRSAFEAGVELFFELNCESRFDECEEILVVVLERKWNLWRA